MIDILSETNGVSGAEDNVRNYIKKALENTAFDIEEDRMGNLFARTDKAENAPSIILSAHMDEVGLIITSVTDDGYLKFDTIGEIPAASLLSKRVSVEGISGVISAKAVHLMSKEERNKPVNPEDLFIDIGATSAAETMMYVAPGDYCSFDSDFCHLGDDYISGKALSGRCGCEILINILKSIDTKNINVTAIFTTQKNVASRGIKTALYSVKSADLAVVFDCAEVNDTEFLEYDTKILLSKNSPNQHCREYAEKLISAAERCGIKGKIGTTEHSADAEMIIKERPYIPTVIAAIPCMNINTPSEIMKKGSAEAIINIVLKFTEMIENGI